MNEHLMQDFSAYAIPASLFVGLIMIVVLARPSWLMVVVPGVLVLLQMPPINSQYSDLALSVGSVSIHIFDILLVGSGLLTARVMLSSSRPASKALMPSYWLLVLLFICWHFLRVLIDLWIHGSSFEMVMRLFAGRAFVILVVALPMIIHFEKNFSWSNIISWWLFLGALLPAFALINMVMHPDGIMITSSGTRRYLFSASNIFMGFCFVFVMVGVRARVIGHFYALLYLTWILLGMALTQHRSVAVALALVVVVDTIFCAKGWERVLRSFLFLVSISILVVVGPALKPDSSGLAGETYKRISDTLDMSNSTTAGRLQKWEERLNLIRSKPFMGSGFAREDVTQRSVSLIDRQRGHEAHNFVISILTYEGFIGLIINLFLLLFAIKHSWMLLRLRSVKGSEIPFLCLTFYTIYSLFNTTYFNPLTAPIYFALVGTIAYMQKEFLIKRNMPNNAKGVRIRC